MSDPLLQPLQINKLTVRNRIVETAHCPSYAEDGMPKERYQLYHEEKAKGGIGLVMFGGSSCVGPDSPSVFGQLNVGVDDVIPWLTQFSDRIHQHDCGIICQISHLGRRTTWNVADWLPVVGASRVREPAHRGFPKVMDKADIARVRGYYVKAALRCKEGGLDGVEIMQNGHLPGQFLAPDTNLRTDEYGGSLENRGRFIREIFDAVREAVGPDFIVGSRVDMDSAQPGGLEPSEALEHLKAVEGMEVLDYLNLYMGRADTEWLLATYQVPSMFQKLAPFLQAAGAFKQQLTLPILHATRIADLATARFAVEEGLLDLVGMTRAHIADPHLVNKLKSGNEHRIRTCVGAGYCIDRIYGEGEALCIQNVATGREKTIPHLTEKSSKPGRKVVVVGGGPAGLEAARVSAERGHNVVLFEASAELGGQVRIAAKADVRKDIVGIADWLASEVELLGVDIRWNTMADTEMILAESPDIVYIATGGVPDTDLVPGGEHCISTWDVLTGSVRLEGTVLMYDDLGQHQAASTVNFMSDRGIEVELVTPDRHACAEMGGTNYPMYTAKFHEAGVTITPDFRLTRIERTDAGLKASFVSDSGGAQAQRLADHIVVEHGTLPLEEVYLSLRTHSNNDGVTDYDALLAEQPQPEVGSQGFSLFRVGDCVASRNIHAAILDSRRIAQHL